MDAPASKEASINHCFLVTLSRHPPSGAHVDRRDVLPPIFLSTEFRDCLYCLAQAGGPAQYVPCGIVLRLLVDDDMRIVAVCHASESAELEIDGKLFFCAISLAPNQRNTL